MPQIGCSELKAKEQNAQAKKWDNHLTLHEELLLPELYIILKNKATVGLNLKICYILYTTHTTEESMGDINTGGGTGCITTDGSTGCIETGDGGTATIEGWIISGVEDII